MGRMQGWVEFGQKIDPLKGRGINWLVVTRGHPDQV